MKYKIYLWLVSQRDKNHSPKKGFTLAGYFWQTLVYLYGFFWSRKNRSKNDNSITSC